VAGGGGAGAPDFCSWPKNAELSSTQHFCTSIEETYAAGLVEVSVVVTLYLLRVCSAQEYMY
jgi:hypothetical protein